MNYPTIQDIINQEKQEAKDAGMIKVGILADVHDNIITLEKGKHFVHSAWGFRPINYLSGDGYDIVTGEGWDQRTFACHGGTTIYAKEIQECQGCGNEPDLCICEELDYYGDDVESANYGRGLR